jgi:hypothetical protein
MNDVIIDQAFGQVDPQRITPNEPAEQQPPSPPPQQLERQLRLALERRARRLARIRAT